MTVTIDEAPRPLLGSEQEYQGRIIPVASNSIFTVFARLQKVVDVDPVHRREKSDYGRKAMLGQQSR